MRLCDVCKMDDEKKIKANVQIKGFEKLGNIEIGGGKPILLFDDVDICDQCLHKLKGVIRDFLKGRSNS